MNSSLGSGGLEPNLKLSIFIILSFVTNSYALSLPVGVPQIRHVYGLVYAQVRQTV